MTAGGRPAARLLDEATTTPVVPVVGQNAPYENRESAWQTVEPNAESVRRRRDTVADTLGRQSPEVRQVLPHSKDDPTAFARLRLPEGCTDSVQTSHDTAELPTATSSQGT